MRVLFVKCGKRNEGTIDAAFVVCGVETVIYSGRSYEHIIRDSAPDLVFTACFIPALSDVCMGTGVPYAAWLMESPDMSAFRREIANGCNRVFISDHLLYEKINTLGLEHIYFMPNGFPDGHDVSEADIFAAHNFGRQDRMLYEKLMRGLDDSMRGYLNGLMNAQLKAAESDVIYGGITQEALEAMKKSCDVPNPLDISNLRYIYSEYLLRRHMVAEEEKLIESTVAAAGLTDQKISVLSFENTAESFMRCSAAGRLVISDSCGLQGTDIKAEEDYVLYTGKAQLAAKLQYYAGHDAESRQIVAHTQKKLRKGHTLSGHIMEILHTCL